METVVCVTDPYPYCTFNFLASLINGNLCNQTIRTFHDPPFNFLASLINGNLLEEVDGLIFSFQPFNFLASLINGNK